MSRAAKRSAATVSSRMPEWDGHPSTAIAHLDALELFVTNAQIQSWRDAGMSEAWITVEARTLEAQHRAVFDQLRSETTARLGVGVT